MAEVFSSSPPDRLIETRRAVVVLVTWPADRDAADVARLLVEEGLAACVNVSAEMTSTYRWHGEVSVDRERQLILKTTVTRVEALLARVRALHPYEVPEFLVLPASAGSASYLGWLERESAG
jgi:periplasmic divalent cation tolerance protein